MNTRLPLKESLFLGFCAVLILSAKAALRLHLHIPGHSMVTTMFFLMLSRACVRYRFSASLTGFMAGAVAVILGMGKGGVLNLLKFVVPGMAIDIGALLFPMMFDRVLLCALLGAVAASTKFFGDILIDTLMGMDKTVMLQHAALKSVGNIGFGVLGSLFVPSVVKKLKHHGIIDE